MAADVTDRDGSLKIDNETPRFTVFRRDGTHHFNAVEEDAVLARERMKHLVE